MDQVRLHPYQDRPASWQPSSLTLGNDALHYSYPEIRPLLESKGVQAAGTGDSTSEFTLPAIEHDGNVVMDSFAIAKYLEKAFPDRPPVFFAQSQALCVLLTNQLMTHIGRVLFPLLLPRIVALLDDKGADYFRRTREAKFKLAIMEDINKDTERVQKTWESVKQPLSVINDMLKQNTEGPYFYGRTRSYADCILLAFLKWWKRCGEKDFFDKVLELAPEFRKVWEASSDILSLP